MNTAQDTAPTGKPHLTREHARELLHGMVLIRRFEEKCGELYTKEKIRGFLHLYIGEEANAVGVMRALSPEDAVVSTYRDHGHALSRGLPPNEVMAELYGKASGTSRGRGGSMHLFDTKRRFYGGSAIVGGGVPLAVGLALADKMRGIQRVTCCFLGDGTVAEGVFHESLNLASLWKLPVLFVCENNLYAMGTYIERALAVPEIHRHAASYNIPAQVVDGMDPVEVEAATRRAAEAVRGGQGPQLLENKTYRYCAHSMFDAELYRDKAEIERWKQRDPIRCFSAWVLQNGFLHEDDIAAIETGVEATVAEAVAFAEASPWEPVETLTRDVYASWEDAPRKNAPVQRGAPGIGIATGGDAGAAAPSPREAPGNTGATRTITYREAAREAMREALKRDPRVFLMGEDVGRYGGSFAVSMGLQAEFGEERIRDAPLCEASFTGAGIGAAIGGVRPIVEIMTINFSLLALDQIVNNAATLRHMSGGQVGVPLVIRMATGAGRQLAAQHSHTFEGWYAHIPGLRVLAPATVADTRGMLWTALQDPDPVVILEHLALYNDEGEVPASGDLAVDIDHAAVRREGRDVSLITFGGSVKKALQAAERLAQEGIDAEVVDLRTLRPLDDATILASVAKTHRVVLVDESWRSGGMAAEIAARIQEHAFFELDAPVARVCSAEVPIPYPRHLEMAATPQPETIVATVLQVLRR